MNQTNFNLKLTRFDLLVWNMTLYNFEILIIVPCSQFHYVQSVEGAISDLVLLSSFWKVWKFAVADICLWVLSQESPFFKRSSRPFQVSFLQRLSIRLAQLVNLVESVIYLKAESEKAKNLVFNQILWEHWCLFGLMV